MIVLAAVGFWPTPVDKPVQGTLGAILRYLHGNGVPGWFDYHFVEASANVAMFVPLGILSSMAFPARSAWQLAGIGLLVSICMEGVQLLLIAARFSSIIDVVTNTAGALIGIGAVRLVAQVAARTSGCRGPTKVR
ncbi:VanZ family protein [Paenarthrobacter nitroguajacolicus]|uniref:VanZ family protein n=1 Tax=Paenarthrobacter nitroguajacolicus TaxID=211146 RepID=UPI0021173B9A|nr:VanZ family protein [Paenarthrobacter nitroguajacolicus]